MLQLIFVRMLYVIFIEPFTVIHRYSIDGFDSIVLNILLLFFFAAAILTSALFYSTIEESNWITCTSCCLYCQSVNKIHTFARFMNVFIYAIQENRIGSQTQLSEINRVVDMKNKIFSKYQKKKIWEKKS